MSVHVFACSFMCGHGLVHGLVWCGCEDVGDDARCSSAASLCICVYENVLLKVYIYQREFKVL